MNGAILLVFLENGQRLTHGGELEFPHALRSLELIGLRKRKILSYSSYDGKALLLISNKKCLLSCAKVLYNSITNTDGDCK